MAFKIVVLPQVGVDVDETTLFIAARGNPERAREWREGVRDAIRALSERPEAGLAVPEKRKLLRDYRHIHYHAHGIVYFIDKASETVVVARVYHGARRTLCDTDL